MKNLLICSAAALALSLTACGDKTNDGAKETTKTTKAEAPAPVKTAPVAPVKKTVDPLVARKALNASINHADRPAKDKADDAARKPIAVIRFSGIKPGDSVVELEAGAGYYTELFSRFVGAEGKVLMQNPAAFDAFLGQDVMDARLGADGTRLSNVTLSKSNFDKIDAADNSVDLVTWILGPHELFYSPAEGVTFGAADDAYAEIYRVLKPGGNFLALDHAAAAGAPETTGGTTHRIDPASVRTRAETAGFKYVKQSKALANAEDNYDLGVFDAKVRRKTDRFMHLYTK